MKLRTVTITGADDSVDPAALAQISTKYPFIEWAILLSSKRPGTPRYPSQEWIGELSKQASYLRLSGHVCGRWARDIVEKGEFSVRYECPKIWPIIQRLQLNIKPKEITNPFTNALKLIHDKQIIIPVNSFDCENLLKLRKEKIDIVPLFDKSGGNGKIPDMWPKGNPEFLNGYAGGLGPENLEQSLPMIIEAAGSAEFWIDMETKVRSEDNILFDMEKVEEVCNIAAPFICSDVLYQAIMSTPAGRMSVMPQ